MAFQSRREVRAYSPGVLTAPLLKQKVEKPPDFVPWPPWCGDLFRAGLWLSASWGTKRSLVSPGATPVRPLAASAGVQVSFYVAPWPRPHGDALLFPLGTDGFSVKWLTGPHRYLGLWCMYLLHQEATWPSGLTELPSCFAQKRPHPTMSSIHGPKVTHRAARSSFG